jgi:hypothetical protein
MASNALAGLFLFATWLLQLNGCNFWKFRYLWKQNKLYDNLGSWILSQAALGRVKTMTYQLPSPAQLIPTIVMQSCHNVSANVHYPRDVGIYNVSNLICVTLSWMPLLILQLLYAVIMCLWTKCIMLALSRCALGGSPLCAAHPALKYITWACPLLLRFPVKQ